MTQRQCDEFPHLARLQTLVMKGDINSHCLPLLLSIPVRCPQLSFCGFEDLCIQQYDVDSDDDGHGDGAGDDAHASASYNHALHPESAIHDSILAWAQRAAVRAPAAEKPIEYVQFNHLGEQSWNDWAATTVLSPFRFLPRSGGAAAVSSAPSA